jgi:hypothetical protein
MSSAEWRGGRCHARASTTNDDSVVMVCHIKPKDGLFLRVRYNAESVLTPAKGVLVNLLPPETSTAVTAGCIPATCAVRVAAVNRGTCWHAVTSTVCNTLIQSTLIYPFLNYLAILYTTFSSTGNCVDELTEVGLRKSRRALA